MKKIRAKIEKQKYSRLLPWALAILFLIAAVLIITVNFGGNSPEDRESSGIAESTGAPESSVITESSGAPESSDSVESTENTEHTGETDSTEAVLRPEKRVLVIETTDMHGAVMDASSGKAETFQYRLAYIAHRVDEARASGQYDDVLLLDGGDLYQGAPASSLTGGAVMRAALDIMGYDAVALGNHEFDWDVTDYAADQKGTVAPYVLGELFGDPDTPVLAPGLYDAATGQRVPFTRDYTIVDKAGLRIAVIGYIPDYSDTILAEKIAPYTIDGSLEGLDALVRSVHEKEKPDAVVILAHAEPVPVAEAMDPQLVSLVAGGHSHKIAAETAENGIACIQGECNAGGFASAVLVFGSDGTVRTEDMAFTGITGDKTLLYDSEENAGELDPEILALSHMTWEVLQEEMKEVLGYIDADIVRKEGLGSHPMGNWITGLMLRVTQKDGAQMAFYNTGGIRANLKLQKGQATRDVTVYDIYSILPFGNSLLLYDLTAKELAKQLANGLKWPNHGDQMTGLSFTYSATGDDGMDRADRDYTILSITLEDGTQVDLNDTRTLYRVCTTSYSATVPGSVFEQKEPVIPMSDAPVDNEAIVRLLREEKQAGDGHIHVDTRARSEEVPQP